MPGLPARIAVLVVCAIAAVAGPDAAAAPRDPALEARIAALEKAVERNPEDLFTAADYRQLVIAAGDFDRSISLFERLARNTNAGPNVHISLGLAYVDKVPTSGDIRRLYLARDAIGEATRAIERQPTVLAYYLRGRISLFLNNVMWARVDGRWLTLLVRFPKVFARKAGFIFALQRARVKIALGIIACTPLLPSTSCVMSRSAATLDSI